MLIGEYIRVSDGTAACNRCQTEFTAVSENFKNGLAVREFPIERAGPHYVDLSRFIADDESMVFREYYCPGCATMLFTETAREGEPPVNEFELDPDTM